MKITGKLILFALIFSALQICTDEASAQQRPGFVADTVSYLWPTNASNYLSATFGETRARHFHSAVDIGTWAREGFEIYASRSGYVYRVGVSAVGYGNVIYLQHNDGSFTVYAHLLDFHPKIRTVVDSIRFQDYSFTFDEVLIHHNIYFEQGDVIGLSGSTGVGPPHLHVEVRSPNNVVYNPLLFGFHVPDGIPPTIRSLSIEPKSPHTLIEGKPEIFTKDATASRGVYNFGTVEVNGPVGLGLNVFDRADGRPNVYAVYELEASVNGEQFFHSRVDSFSFDTTHQMFLDRVYPILLASRRGFQRLYIKDGNQLPFYTTNEQSGVLDLPEGRHTVEFTARDFFGNTSRARLQLNVVPKKNSPAPKFHFDNNPASLPQYAAAPADDWIWHNNWVQPSGEIHIRKMGSFRDSEKILNHGQPLLLQNSPTLMIDGERLLHRIYPQNRNSVYTTDQRFSAHFLPGSVYDTMSIALHWEFSEDDLPELSIYPNHEPIYMPVELRFLLTEQWADNHRLGLYFRLPRSGNYRLVDSHVDGFTFRGEVTHFDTFYVLKDTLAPEITEPRIYQRPDGKWMASVTVTDDLSGIDYDTAEFYSNNTRGIAEFDPEKNLIIYHHPDFEPSPQNILRVSVSDKMGNRTEAEFTVRRP